MILTMSGNGERINLRELPDGRICIHWFVRDENGPLKTEDGNVMSDRGPFVFPGSQGRIACNPTQNAVLRKIGNETMVCMRSDDLRAVTCEACLATEEAKALMAEEAAKQ